MKQEKGKNKVKLMLSFECQKFNKYLTKSSISLKNIET